ncbi:type VI secretion system-associated protein TagO [Rhizobium laguerreae]|uniref:type VI secretion system-associated protein TagO n=1 Tax=Rhizobium laguerreae TaxID=1076926 RepID=UPI0014425B08|nr:type VI secretion system-associated protein TagO [Rhizobium laguerreae]NKM24956.1 hypothetical protein [Rhizobium laguerreae]
MARILVLGAAALMLGEGTAFAASPEECSAMSDDTSRLACYDAIYRKSAATQPETTASKWVVETQKSKMDDSETIYMALTSEQFGSVINIRCEEKVTSVYFTMGGDFMADIQGYGLIRYRLDADKQQKKSFTVSTDNQALGLWSGGSAVPFLKQLLGHKKLTAQITAYNESPTTVEYDLTGIDAAIVSLRKQCGW